MLSVTALKNVIHCQDVCNLFSIKSMLHSITQNGHCLMRIHSLWGVTGGKCPGESIWADSFVNETSEAPNVRSYLERKMKFRGKPGSKGTALSISSMSSLERSILRALMLSSRCSVFLWPMIGKIYGALWSRYARAFNDSSVLVFPNFHINQQNK